MNGSPLAVRKLIVGILALASLASAAGLWAFSADALTNPVFAVTMRLGLMLGALWLALPDRGDSIALGKGLPVILAVIAVLALVRNWRVLIYAVPAAIVVGIVLAFIRPRSNRRPPRRPAD